MISLKNKLVEILFNYMNKSIISINIPFSELVNIIFSEPEEKLAFIKLLVPFEDYIELIKDEVCCITAFI